jgi:hypothetical protein
MNRRYFLLLCILAALLIASLVVTLGTCGGGRPLDDYLVDLGRSGGNYALHTNAVAAIKQIGTNAIPRLLQLLRSHDSGLKLRCMDLLAKQGFIHWGPTRAEEKRRRAFLGFEALGPEAAPAIPELLALLKTQPDDVAAYATFALGSLRTGEDLIIPGLTNALASRGLAARIPIEDQLGRMRKNPAASVPALVARLSTTNVLEFLAVSDALRNFGAAAVQA